MTELVILDMDGLMIDSERVSFEVFRRVFSAHGEELPLDFYRDEMIGRNAANIRATLEARYPDPFPVDEALQEAMAGIAEAFSTDGTPVKPGLYELIRFAKESGRKVYVATSSSRDRVGKILADIGVLADLDGFVCGDEVSRGKPDPEIFLTTLQKAGTRPEHALVLEDSPMGIEAAYLAGIPVICVPDMIEPTEETRAKCVFVGDSLLDARDYLQKEAKHED